MLSSKTNSVAAVAGLFAMLAVWYMILQLDRRVRSIESSRYTADDARRDRRLDMMVREKSVQDGLDAIERLAPK